jgi:hypothetical protein
MKKVVSAAMAGLLATGSFNLPAQALTRQEILSLSYEQVKGTGIANRCPEAQGEQTISLSSGKKYKITDFCMEPKTFQVSFLSMSRSLQIWLKRKNGYRLLSFAFAQSLFVVSFRSYSGRGGGR